MTGFVSTLGLIPDDFDLREPLEIILVMDVKSDHLVDRVSLVEQVEDDVSHDHSLSSSQAEINSFVLPVASSLFTKRPDDLVDPEKDTQEDSIEGLLT